MVDGRKIRSSCERVCCACRTIWTCQLGQASRFVSWT